VHQQIWMLQVKGNSFRQFSFYIDDNWQRPYPYARSEIFLAAPNLIKINEIGFLPIPFYF